MKRSGTVETSGSKRTRSASQGTLATSQISYARRKKKSSPEIARYEATLGRTIGFPKLLKFKHRYHEQFGLTSTTGALNTYNFRCNSLFDPNQTGTGHQPLYYDNLVAIYRHFTVIGAKCTFRVVPDGSSAQAPFQVTCWINDDTTSPANIDTIAESKSSKTVIVGGINPQQQTVTLYWSGKQFFGVAAYNDDMQGQGVNPSEQSYFTYSMQPLDKTSSVTARVLVTIDYITLWSELSDQAQN